MPEALAKGLRNVYLDTTESSFIDGEKGVLLYRGYSIHDLAEHSSFEEATYLLLLYRRGFPSATPLSVFGAHTLTARALNCCVSHASLSEEIEALGISEFWPPPALGSDEDITPFEDRIVQ